MSSPQHGTRITCFHVSTLVRRALYLLETRKAWRPHLSNLNPPVAMQAHCLCLTFGSSERSRSLLLGPAVCTSHVLPGGTCKPASPRKQWEAVSPGCPLKRNPPSGLAPLLKESPPPTLVHAYPSPLAPLQILPYVRRTSQIVLGEKSSLST